MVDERLTGGTPEGSVFHPTLCLDHPDVRHRRVPQLLLAAEEPHPGNEARLEPLGLLLARVFRDRLAHLKEVGSGPEGVPVLIRQRDNGGARIAEVAELAAGQERNRKRLGITRQADDVELALAKGLRLEPAE